MLTDYSLYTILTGMRLADWIEREGRGAISRLVRETGCAASTFHTHINGKPIAEYQTAKRISEATGGEVSIEELCEPPRRKRTGTG